MHPKYTLLLGLLVGALLFFFCSCASINPVTPYGTGHDDSNTVNPLDAVNPASGTFGSTSYPGQLYNSLSKEDANRWSEQGAPFQNFVSIVAQANSCLGGTSAGLTMTPTSCVAYNAGYRGTETGSITFPNASTCWVAMDENTSGSNAGLANFTRVPATHYLIDCIDVTQPTMAADSQLLMEVTTVGGAITAVVDKRTTKEITAVGTVTSITATSPIVVTPSPLVSTGVISTTTIPASLGGTGIASPTAHDILIAQGASAMNVLNLGADTFLQGQGASSDPTAGAIPGCASDGVHALTYASHALACTVISAALAAHGQQLFTTNGTFTVPAGVFSIRVECWGSGAGGGGYGVGDTAGGNGNATTVGSVCTANGGTGGTGAAAGAIALGGAGGVVAGAVGTLKLSGGPGFAGNTNSSVTGGGGVGGTAPRGNADNENPAPAGAGGAGGGANASQQGAGGGGSGGYSEAQVTTTPSSTFTVTLGTAGTAGTGGTANGQAGGAGEVLVSW